jgi:hypothetical protein
MRKTAIVLLLLALLLPTLAIAGAPLEGVWKSTDLGGPVPLGRYTEGWMSGGGALLAGTAFNAASWDGTTLGDSWSYHCAVEGANAVLVDDSVVSGFGTRTWKCTFTGGTIWLSGSGPWGNGDAQYTGPILSYVEYETLTYVAGMVIEARTNVNATAMIEGYETVCLGFTVGNGAKIGDGLPPANYPPELNSSCGSAINGAFWDFAQLTLYITNCEVGTQESSWSSVKAQYR